MTLAKPGKVTQLLDFFFDEVHLLFVHLGLRKHGENNSASDFYVLFLTLTALLSFVPLVCFYTLSQDPHVVHWLGTEPQYVNLAVPVLLVVLVASMPFLKYLHTRRETVRVAVLILFLGASAAMIVSAVHLLHSSRAVSNQLVFHCGQRGSMSALLESEWRVLDQFHRTCVESVGNQSLHVQNCPGFVGLLTVPGRAETVAYLHSAEETLHCAGFCHFWASPLFTSGQALAGRRCASELGAEVGHAGALAALPTAFTGLVLLVVGAGLAGYENL
mmetsp:Transcript_18882/g.49095  ORF Transcript_18882/g.49095 Transcript_18882/m.49095 type:complete len:274 (-) Transcript_18882:195-1016(-)|eukprot:CAMPEP_0183438342 /NCGR_PEP_ID=MMETSP0370-20130417/77272_1 /TAXON_ID=268820 /ORGANISM="Peridinium aciculiferum, Strain PAER-2" /LENGTH=273 /DNA_ID=CAMNT_0025626541 /DNA_START=174 /DNA_END=995 /DNA_ORIENTATION=+